MNPRDKFVTKAWDELNLIVLKGPPMHPHLHGGKGGMPRTNVSSTTVVSPKRSKSAVATGQPEATGLSEEKGKVEKERIKKLFARYDLDNSGTINSDQERQQLVTNLLMAEQNEYLLKGKTFTFKKKSLLTLIEQELAAVEPITEGNE